MDVWHHVERQSASRNIEVMGGRGRPRRYMRECVKGDARTLGLEPRLHRTMRNGVAIKWAKYLTHKSVEIADIKHCGLELEGFFP